MMENPIKFLALAGIAPNYKMLDSDACRAWWLGVLHPAGPVCPGCGVSLVGRSAERFKSGDRVVCGGCGKWFNARTGTPIDRMAADFRQLFIFVDLASRGIRTVEIAAACGLSEDTIDRYRLKLEMRRKNGRSD